MQLIILQENTQKNYNRTLVACLSGDVNAMTSFHTFPSVVCQKRSMILIQEPGITKNLDDSEVD